MAKATGWHDRLPSLSTGHDTTAASVNLSLQRILLESGRDLSRERVGLLGAGSIGCTSLLLMMQSMPPPAELILCDLYDHEAALQSLARLLRHDCGYRGKLRLLSSRGRTPSAFYSSSVIIGATNVADVLEVDQLSPGTLIVDDSTPLCLSPDRAIQRMRDRGDILVTSGGILQTEETLWERVRPPQGLEGCDFSSLYDVSDPHRIGACVLSSLLSAKFEMARSDLGPATAASAHRHLTLLASLGIKVGDLRLGQFAIGHSTVECFRQRFGNTTGIAYKTGEHCHGDATPIDR